MIVRVYALIWVLGLMMAGVLYFTGNLTPLLQVVFGFLTFGTIFMGMLSVLPAATTHHEAPKH
jgi:hypothetical protein